MQRWKRAEYKAAQLLGGRRISRGADFSESAPDVIIEDFNLAVDAKVRKSIAVIGWIRKAKEKYGKRVALYLREHNTHDDYVLLPGYIAAELLEHYRQAVPEGYVTWLEEQVEDENIYRGD